MTIHVVRSGESVASIAEIYGVDPVRLASDNSVPSSGALAVGQTLVVRFPALVHTVQPGETLQAIASAYGVTVRKLWQNNWFLGGQWALTPGQQLVLSYETQPDRSGVFNGYAYPFIAETLLAQQLPSPASRPLPTVSRQREGWYPWRTRPCAGQRKTGECAPCCTCPR